MTKFIDNATLITADWLNSVDSMISDLASVKVLGAKGDGVADDTASIQAAIDRAKATGGRVELPPPPVKYKITSSLDLRNSNGVEFIGQGLPVIEMATANTPIILAGGERLSIKNLKLQYAALPASTDTNAIAIRVYNLYESIVDRIYFYQVYGAMDQYQGLVNGGQNAFFSNTVSNIRCVYFSGWAINMQPYNGGNSGNYWNNIYINNRNGGGGASSSYACKGGMYLKTAQNDVVNLLNLEWMAFTTCALILNQCGNAVFNGLHIEGNYCTTAYQPYIDAIGGDGGVPVINGLTLVGNDFGGVVGQALFRVNSTTPIRILVNGLLSLNNTTPANMNFLTYGGTSAYGCYVEVTNANVDTALASDPYSPKVSYGTVVPNVEIPIQRWNLNIPKHSASVVDNTTGTQTSGMMTGTVTSTSYDPMGLWDAANTRFNIKQSGTYLCSVYIPTGSSPVVYVQKNYGNVAMIPVTVGLYGGGGSVQLQLARGDTVEFYLASGSYTKTNVTFGVSLAS